MKKSNVFKNDTIKVTNCDPFMERNGHTVLEKFIETTTFNFLQEIHEGKYLRLYTEILTKLTIRINGGKSY